MTNMRLTVPSSSEFLDKWGPREVQKRRLVELGGSVQKCKHLGNAYIEETPYCLEPLQSFPEVDQFGPATIPPQQLVGLACPRKGAGTLNSPYHRGQEVGEGLGKHANARQIPKPAGTPRSELPH